MNARDWLAAARADPYDLAVLGAPISRASISPSQAHTTPPALREALARFSTWDEELRADLEELRLRDLGDVEGDHADADALAAHGRIAAAVRRAAAGGATVAVIGGDNSVTRAAMTGLAPGELDAGWGLLTFDAHHDVRPTDAGSRNGTPVRELIEAGLPGRRVMQIGIHGFANEREHAQWALDQGIHVRRASQVRQEGMARILAGALAQLSDAGVSRIYVDIDIDVLDRAYAPACPASMPGGLLPHHLQEAACALGRDPRVRAVDLCEVDAAADVAGTTLRAMASVFLAFCAGMVLRRRDAVL